jgi:preprotein translocase SecE subunit
MAIVDRKSVMAQNPTKAINPDEDDDRDDSTTAAPAKVARAGGDGFAVVYKPNQGQYLRWSTAVAAVVISMGAALFVRDQIRLLPFAFADSEITRIVAPLLVFLPLVWWIWRLVGVKPMSVDFLIETEQEVRRVHWSTYKEIMGTTRVVIVVIFALGILLFLVDAVFIVFFDTIGVLKFGIAEWFGRRS